MLSAEAAQRIREMSVADRVRQTLQMIDEGVPLLTHGHPDQVRRRFELLRHENDERNQRMLAAFARTKMPNESAHSQPN